MLTTREIQAESDQTQRLLIGPNLIPPLLPLTSSLSPPPRRHQPHRVPCCGPQAPSPSSTAITRSDKDDEMPRIPISSTALLVRRRCCLIFITSTSLPPDPAPPARLTTTPRAPGRARPKGERLGPRWDPPAHAVRSAVQCSGRKEQEHRYPWAGPEREGAVSNRTVGTYSVEGREGCR